MIGKQGLHGELLLVAALRMANAGLVQEAAVDDAEISVFDGSIFEWPGAKFTAFFGTAAAEVLCADGGVEPGSRRPIVGVAKDETFPRAVAWLRNQETGLADFASRGCGGVRKPNEWDAEEAKIRVDERDGLIQTNARVRGVELPFGMLRVADGDPGFTNEVDIAGKAFHFAGLEVERILGQQEGGIGAALDLHGAVDVAEEAAAGADVVMGFVAIEMLIFVIELHMAASNGLRRLVVVFDVVGAQAQSSIADVYVAVRDVEVALAALRSGGRKLGDAALAGGQANLLWTRAQCR